MSTVLPICGQVKLEPGAEQSASFDGRHGVSWRHSCASYLVLIMGNYMGKNSMKIHSMGEGSGGLAGK